MTRVTFMGSGVSIDTEKMEPGWRMVDPLHELVSEDDEEFDVSIRQWRRVKPSRVGHKSVGLLVRRKTE